MDNIIDEKKNLNNKIILYSSILTVIIFMIIGNLNLITMLCSNTLNLGKIDILKRGFSMSVFDVSILYIVLCILVYTVLKDKQQILKNYIKAKVKVNSILNKEIKFLNTIILISISINLCIKFILYFVFRKTLVSFGIGFNDLLLSLFYIILVTCILYLLVIINYVSIKDFISGTFVYCVILGILSVILGAGSLFISDKILFVQNILNLVYAVYNPIIMPFYAFYNVYNESLLTNLGVILTLSVMTLLLLYIFKNFCSRLNKDNIKKFYISSTFRKIFLMSGAVAVSYIIFLIGFVLLVSFNIFSYDIGILIINLVQIAFSIILYVKLNGFYLNRQTSKKKEDIKIKGNESLLRNTNIEKEDVLKNVYNRLNENKSIYKDNIENTKIFKSLNLENELLDRQRIKDFSFNELDECLLNDDNDVIEYKFNDLKNDIKAKEIDKDEENLIDFLNSDSIIKN